LCRIFVASEALFPFLDFEKAAVQAFVVRLYKRIAASVAHFCTDLDMLANPILRMLNRLLCYVAHFMAGALELPELALQTIPGALAEIGRRKKEFDDSPRLGSNEFENCSTIELQFGQLFINVAKHWPQIAATFPIAEVPLEPTQFPYAVTCGVAAFLPQMMTVDLAEYANEMHAKVFEIQDKGVDALGVSCRLFEALVKEKVVPVEQVSQMVQGCMAWTKVAKNRAFKWEGAALSCLLLAIMAHYHSEMDLSVAFTLFCQFMASEPELLDALWISEIVEDLAAVVGVLRPAGEQAKWFGNFIRLLEKPGLFPWDVDAVAEVKEVLLAAAPTA
jgi:hypothetical protein